MAENTELGKDWVPFDKNNPENLPKPDAYVWLTIKNIATGEIKTEPRIWMWCFWQTIELSSFDCIIPDPRDGHFSFEYEFRDTDIIIAWRYVLTPDPYIPEEK